MILMTFLEKLKRSLKFDFHVKSILQVQVLVIAVARCTLAPRTKL